MPLTKCQIRDLNKTYRKHGAVGAQAITPRYIAKIAELDDRILDYGSGKFANHARALRQLGFMVDAWDIGDNWQPQEHILSLQGRSGYDIVYGSNLINVQTSRKMLKEMLVEIWGLLGIGSGRFICNYPTSPRKLPLTNEEMCQALKEVFPRVMWHRSNGCVIFICWPFDIPEVK